MPRDIAQLEELSLPEMVPEIIDEIATIDTFSAAIYTRAIVTNRQSITVNRKVARGTAQWNTDRVCTVETSAPSSDKSLYPLDLLTTAYDVCQPNADIYSGLIDVETTENIDATLRMIETMNNAIINGNGENIDGLDSELAFQTIDQTADAGGEMLKAMDLAYLKATPKRDLVWVTSIEGTANFLEEVRNSTLGGDSMVTLFGTTQTAPAYHGIPVTTSEWVPADTAYLVSLSQSGLNVYFGRANPRTVNDYAIAGGLIGVRPGVRTAGSLVDETQLYTNATAFYRNRQTGVKVINFG